MKTYKPLATISYNTPEYLHSTLEQLKTLGKIDFWMTAFHLADEGKKDHFHVYIEPSDTIDTNADWFKTAFEEKQSNGPALGCMPWRKSKFEDWFLYAKHDSAYLHAKYDT